MGHVNGSTNSDLGQLIDALYDTALAVMDECAWCNVLPKLGHALDASAGSFMTHDLAAGDGALRHRFNIQTKYYDAYNDGLSALDPWMTSAALYEEGAVIACEDVLSERELKQTEFYKRYLQPQALLHHLCGVISCEGAEATVISFMRPAHAAHFGREERVALSRLLPHLKRTMKVRDEVVRDRHAHESLAEIIDHLPVAFIVVDHTGRVNFCNRVANDMFACGDGLRLRTEGVIATASSKNTADLRQLIADTAGAAPNGRDPTSGEHFIISRGPERLPLICVMYRVNGSGHHDDQIQAPAVALVIKDPLVDSGEGLTDFARAYKLTNAEARLVCLLTDGHGLFDAGHKLGITKNTARTHMRNIYSKVGTNRQADLVRLLGRFSVF
ncbi:helix-turn-helix transcriptional regulator [Pelagibius sp.]|uniref:helix-turn-helix transcriptional regulator n=1 Tax=Pelagibius sp. TaxID=1931238 RepID=UPI0026081993|nr:hypothetical protein [Pelagibius sp.]